MNRHILFCLLVTASPVFADGADGFSFAFKQLFGTEEGQKDIAKCDLSQQSTSMSPDIGFIGKFAAILCHLKNEFAFTGPGVKKATFTGQLGADGLPTISSVAKVANTPVTINGVTYAWQAWVWGCNLTKSSDSCASSSDFVGMAYLAWDQTTDLRRGFGVYDNGTFENRPAKSAVIQITFDLSDGKIGSSKGGTVQVRAVMRMGPGLVEYRADGTKLKTASGDNVLEATVLMAQGTTERRMDVYMDRTKKDGCLEFETSGDGSSGTGVGTLNATAKGDTPTGSYFSFLSATGADDNHRDRTITMTTTACPYTMAAYPSDESVTDVAAYTASSLAGSYLDFGSSAPPSVTAMRLWDRLRFAFVGLPFLK